MSETAFPENIFPQNLGWPVGPMCVEWRSKSSYKIWFDKNIIKWLEIPKVLTFCFKKIAATSADSKK